MNKTCLALLFVTGLLLVGCAEQAAQPSTGTSPPSTEADTVGFDVGALEEADLDDSSLDDLELDLADLDW
jgi:hypothetical protein